MELDKKYLRGLKHPLEGCLGLKVSEYFNHLDISNVQYEETAGKLSEKFIIHMEYLIEQGVIVGPIKTESGIRSLGLKVGAGRNSVVVSSGIIKLVTIPLSKHMFRVVYWLRDKVFVVIITGILIASGAALLKQFLKL